MSTKEKYWKYSLVTLILGLGALIVGELWAFVSGLLGDRAVALAAGLGHGGGAH